MMYVWFCLRQKQCIRIEGWIKTQEEHMAHFRILPSLAFLFPICCWGLPGARTSCKPHPQSTRTEAFLLV